MIYHGCGCAEIVTDLQLVVLSPVKSFVPESVMRT